MPTLRFPEFSGEWKRFLLGEISNVTKLAGYEFTKYVIYEDSGYIIALRGLNCKGGKLVLDDVKYIDNSDLSKLTRSKLYIGDILFTYVGTVGEVAIIDEDNKYYLAPNVSRIRAIKKICPSFIMYQLSSHKFYNKVIFPLIATSSQPVLSMENVRKFEIHIPLQVEQTKIAFFLHLIDERISTQNKIIEELKLLKSAIRERLYSHLNTNTNACIGDVLEYEQPTKYIVSSEVYSNIGIPVLTANKAFILGYTDDKNGVYNKSECIIFDDFTMDSKYVDFEFKVKSSALKILTAVDDDIYFLYEYLKYLNLSSTEHKRHFISEVANISIKVPTLVEQQQISIILKYISDKVNLEFQQLSLYIHQKEYLLSQMFI